MTKSMLVNGKTVTTSQLRLWRSEFGGAYVDPRGCLLVRDGDDCNWFVLNAHTAFRERNDLFAGEMHDGLGGYVPHRATVQEFIAAARRLKARREEHDAREARERADIDAAISGQRRLERACARAVGCGTR